MPEINFNSEIEIRDGNPYVYINKELARKIKSEWRKPMPVIIKVNGLPKEGWKINMMPVGDGSFYLYLHGYVRKVSNTKVGDKVKITLKFDSEYKNGPMHPMPDWFKNPLYKNAKAKKNWEALSPSRQKEILRYFSWIKSDEAKSRNIDRAMQVLSGKEGRFMARSWKNGK